MNVNEIADVGRAIVRLGEFIAAEPWRPDHDQAMECRNLEDEIADCLAIVDGRLEEYRRIVAESRLDYGDVNLYSEEHRRSLAWIRHAWSLAKHTIRSKVDELERSGYEVKGADRIGSRFEAIDALLGPMIRALDASGRAAGPGDEPPSFDSPRPAPAIRIAARPGGTRMPDPPYETGEHPAPFDLPRLGPRTRVEPSRIGRRLPEPHDLDEGDRADV